VKKRLKISLNQSLIYIHPISPTLLPVFLFFPLQFEILKTILRGKKYWRDICPPPSSSEANDPFQSEYSRECDMVLPLSDSFP